MRHLTRRVHECEKTLNLKLPIYIVFSKIDLIEAHERIFEIYNEKVTHKTFGISFKDKLRPDELSKSFKEISDSLLFNFMSKNTHLHSLETKIKPIGF